MPEVQLGNKHPQTCRLEATGGVLRVVLELGDREVLGRGKVPSDSDKIALLRLAYFEGFVNFSCAKEYASDLHLLPR